MPVIAIFILKALSWAAVHLIGPILLKIFLVLGIGFASFSGMEVLMDGIFSEVQGHLSGAGMLVDWLGLLQVDRAISVIFSAISIRVSFGAAKLVMRPAVV